MTIALTIAVPDEQHEWLIAELADLGFDAFEREDDAVIAYGPSSAWTGVAREEVARWLRQHGLPEAFEERTLPQENWNARWEATIEALAVGDFVVAPTWAEIPPTLAEKRLLRIDPKMSFGTGYHASTRLALRFLPGLVTEGMRVLDAGTGTGILAISALVLGASEAIGFDIDPWSTTNATENAELNRVADRFDVREGSLEVVPEGDFGLVLANINRNALGVMLPDLAEKLAESGKLVLAGLLQSDREGMLEAISEVNLTLYDEAVEGEWWSCVCEWA